MVQQLLYKFTFLPAILLAITGSPNNSTLYLKEPELSTAKLGIGSPSGGYIDKELLMNLDNYLNILLNYT